MIMLIDKMVEEDKKNGKETSNSRKIAVINAFVAE